MQEVKFENLIKGKEYWMECFTCNDKQQLIPHNPPYKQIAKYDTHVITDFSSTVGKFLNFRDIKFKDDKNRGYTVTLNNYYWKFYETVKQKVQDNMENRAINIILKRVIRDEYYKY